MGIRIMRCEICGNIVVFLDDEGVTPVCCGQDMTELKAGTDIGGSFAGKHVPVVQLEHEPRRVDFCSGSRSSKLGCCDSYVTVSVGAVQHPMEDGHYIEWVLLQTNCGWYVRYLEPEDKPEATFCFCKGEKPVKAYAYCNTHGLWESRE